MTLDELAGLTEKHQLRCAQDHRLSDRFTISYRDMRKLIAVAKAAKELQALDGAAKSADDFISLRFRLRKALAALESP
jgi:hypothetical protein